MFLADRVLDHVRAVLDEPDLEGTKYDLKGPVGRGGMASVFAAEDRELGREVALKVSSPADGAASMERLRREAKVIARLEHPGIVPVHDVGLLPDGRLFYAMKLVRGETLDTWATSARRLPETLRAIQRCCDAVSFAHAHGVVHRDLKPENVMIGEFGEVLVMDWGVALELASGAEAGDAEGNVIGTPSFMAPEQENGRIADIDARTDVFGLGATLSFVVRQHEPLPPALRSIVAKATASKREDRYATAKEMAADLERFLDREPVAAHRESAIELVARFAGKHRVVLTLLGVYLAVRVVLAVFAR